jgi:hypothetical protein
MANGMQYRSWRVAGPGFAAAAFIAALALAFSAATAPANSATPALAVGGFSYSDTSGEPRNQASNHQAWLDMFSKLVRADLERGGKFALADIQCAAPECAVVDGVAPPALVQSAEQAGVRFLVVGGVQKTSTLVQWARLAVLDLQGRKVVVDRLFSFRGDDEDAWRRAAGFVARYVNDIPAAEVR